MPAPLREIGFDQNLDQRVPLDTAVPRRDGRDASGSATTSAARPVVLVFAYYDCPMLCTQVLNGADERARRAVARRRARTSRSSPSASTRARRRRTAAAKKAAYLERYKRPGAAAGWHFLTGDAAVDRAADEGRRLPLRLGRRRRKQFAHPTGIIVLTPDGRLARYLFGIEYGPRDLRLRSSRRRPARSASPVDSLLLYCYHYDPMTGRYGLAIMRALRVAGAATVLALGAFIVVMLRRERSAGEPRHPSTRHP